VYQQYQSPPASTSSSATLSPDLSSGSSKKSFFRKVSGFRNRSASKSSRTTSTEDATDDESISLPWNFQVSIPFHLSLLRMALTLHVFFFSSHLRHFFSLSRAWNVHLSIPAHPYTHTLPGIAPYPHR
jgi:hypothetical protein